MHESLIWISKLSPNQTPNRSSPNRNKSDLVICSPVIPAPCAGALDSSGDSTGLDSWTFGSLTSPMAWSWPVFERLPSGLFALWSRTEVLWKFILATFYDTPCPGAAPGSNPTQPIIQLWPSSSLDIIHDWFSWHRNVPARRLSIKVLALLSNTRTNKRCSWLCSGSTMKKPLVENMWIQSMRFFEPWETTV